MHMDDGAVDRKLKLKVPYKLCLQVNWSAQDVTLTAMTAEPGAQPSTASAAAGCPITSLSTPCSQQVQIGSLSSPLPGCPLSRSLPSALPFPSSHILKLRLHWLAYRLG